MNLNKFFLMKIKFLKIDEWILKFVGCCNKEKKIKLNVIKFKKWI